MIEAEYKKWKAAGGPLKQVTFDGLTEDSVVFDIGGWKGSWAHYIREKYGCWVFVFEPVASFMVAARESLKNYTKVRFFEYGLGNSDREENWGLDRDSTGHYSAGLREVVKIRDVAGAMLDLEFPYVAVASINIEGGEYELLNRLYVTGLLPKFTQLMIQFHEVGVFTKIDRDNVRSMLSETHDPVYIFDTCWELWQLKEKKCLR